MQKAWQRVKLDLAKHELELNAAKEAWSFLQEGTLVSEEMRKKARARMDLLEGKVSVAKEAVTRTAQAYFYFDV
jgi:hypothetical protein